MSFNIFWINFSGIAKIPERTQNPFKLHPYNIIYVENLSAKHGDEQEIEIGRAEMMINNIAKRCLCILYDSISVCMCEFKYLLI